MAKALMDGMHVVVCTPYTCEAEPRAPRHALAVAALSPRVRVTFVECRPIGQPPSTYNPFHGVANVAMRTLRFPHRRGKPIRLAWARSKQFASRLAFRLFGRLDAIALNAAFCSFERFLVTLKANIYFGHNIETLVPICRAAERNHALAMFDSMEFFSDMGDSQGRLDRRIIGRMEKRYLEKCALVLASSDEMADALVEEYQIRRPLPVYNVPSLQSKVHSCSHEGLSLYWRNAVLGFGQRGLQDALDALILLPESVHLHLQGRLPVDGGRMLSTRIKTLGLQGRVFIHPPYLPPEAVEQAAAHCVGLCLEHSGPRNHELTVSNKMFDYLMAGLVVVASDLPGLRGVVERSRAGLTFRPGKASDLANKIALLNGNKTFLRELAANARAFALLTGNLESEMEKLQRIFVSKTESEVWARS